MTKRKRPATDAAVDAGPGFPIPSVWWDDGYLVLAYDYEDGALTSYSPREATGMRKERAADFVRRMTRIASNLNPTRFILSLIGRRHVGTVDMRIKTERKLVTMLNAEQLATLSNDELAKEYQRICGTETQVVEENKSTIIEELIAQAQADAAKETPTEGKESTMTAQKKSSKAKKPAAKKESAAKKAAPKAKAAAPSKKDAAKKPVAKKESAPKAAKSSGNGADNPFREGTMKAKGFDLFRKAGKDAEPSDLIEKIIKLGATPSTARSWLQVYRQQ